MRVVVTGSSGHLGEGLVRTLLRDGVDVAGVDVRPGAFTTHTGSVADRGFVRKVLERADAVLHAAALHKPHCVTHSRAAFVETNVTGTLNLLEEAVAAGVGRFVYTSTTSTWGHALRPGPGQPAAWVTEDVPAEPANVYGVTKLAAERLCELVHREEGLPCVILRTSRFFPEEDDRREIRQAYDSGNAKLNEALYRRVDLQDAVDAHLAALHRAPELGFGRYIVTATTPFTPDLARELRGAADRVVARLFPGAEALYGHRGWKLFPDIDRVYVNQRAREALGWSPRLDFAELLSRLERGEEPWSELARQVGCKPYHDRRFEDGPYPVRE